MSNVEVTGDVYSYSMTILLYRVVNTSIFNIQHSIFNIPTIGGTIFAVPPTNPSSMADKRHPVYIIAHNPNTLSEVDEVLAAGVNALEPDVQYHKYRKDLCIAHDEPGTSDDPPAIEAYLEHVKRRMEQYPGLSLILFDIKLDEQQYNGIPIADWGTKLRDTANRILGDTGLVIIYSVSKKKQVGIFADLALSLGPKEGIMIDQESDVDEMIEALQPLINKGVKHISYADGSYAYIPHPGLEGHIREALCRCAQTALPAFVGVWVVFTEQSVRKYFRMGVDAMIVTNYTIKDALKVIAGSEFKDRMRLAERSDDPFTDYFLNYGIEINTMNVSGAGTDAVITCTLSGPENSVSFSNIDAGYKNAFEKGDKNFVHLKMANAGTPLSISFTHDGSGFGPDWLPGTVRVFECTTGLDVQANFGEWIKKGEVHTRELK
jgi:hypothetical protein